MNIHGRSLGATTALLGAFLSLGSCGIGAMPSALADNSPSPTARLTASPPVDESLIVALATGGAFPPHPGCNGGGGPGTIALYALPSKTPISSISLTANNDCPTGLAEYGGVLFVASQDDKTGSGALHEYKRAGAGYETTAGVIQGICIDHPAQLAFDSSGDLFVLNREFVSVFRAGRFDKCQTITSDVNSPVGFAVDAKSDLFLANSGGGGSVYEFLAPHYTTTPKRLILAGVRSPGALAVDSSSNLFVADCDQLSGSCPTVKEFGAPYTGSSIRSIKTGTPTALTTDASGNLFVADTLAVTEYAPGAVKHSWRIEDGVPNGAAPVALLVGGQK